MIDFFRKYHAVPADDLGPRWRTATDEALLGWINGAPINAPYLAAVVDEVKRRAKLPTSSQALKDRYAQIHGD